MNTLNPRETELLQLLKQGVPQKEIITTMGLTQIALYRKLKELRNRFNCPNTTALIGYACDHDLLPKTNRA